MFFSFSHNLRPDSYTRNDSVRSGMGIKGKWQNVMWLMISYASFRQGVIYSLKTRKALCMVLCR